MCRNVLLHRQASMLRLYAHLIYNALKPIIFCFERSAHIPIKIRYGCCKLVGRRLKFSCKPHFFRTGHVVHCLKGAKGAPKRFRPSPKTSSGLQREITSPAEPSALATYVPTQ